MISKIIQIVLLIVIVVFTVELNTASAQTDKTKDSTYQFALPQVKIYERSKGKEVITFFDERERNVFLVNDKTLVADTNIYRYSIEIEKLDKISIRDGDNGWSGLGYGALGGFAFGFIVGISMPWNPPPAHDMAFTIPGGWGTAFALGLICAVPTGLIGGIIGVLSPYYEEFVFKDKDIAKKKTALIKVLRNRSFRSTK